MCTCLFCRMSPSHCWPGREAKEGVGNYAMPCVSNISPSHYESSLRTMEYLRGTSSRACCVHSKSIVAAAGVKRYLAATLCRGRRPSEPNAGLPNEQTRSLAFPHKTNQIDTNPNYPPAEKGRQTKQSQRPRTRMQTNLGVVPNDFS